MEIGFALIVIFVIILAIWLIIEFKRMRHKIFAIFLIVMILFFYVSAAWVFRGQNVDYKSVSGLTKAGKVYFHWLGSSFGNVKTITANAIKMDWKSPSNVKNFTSTSR